MKKQVSILIGVFLVMFGTLSFGVVPTLLSYQGKLVDNSGIPIDGNTVMTFSIYDGPSTTATRLWTETYDGTIGKPLVPVFQGHFSVSLGSVVPITFAVFQADTTYLGIKIGTESELVPRVRLLTSPYAFKSEDSLRLEGLSKASFVRTDALTDVTTQIQVSVSKNADYGFKFDQKHKSGYGLSLSAAGTGTSPVFRVTTDNARSLFRVQKDGKVGIGVDTMTEMLEVNGTVKALRFVDANGNPIVSVDKIWTRVGTVGSVYYIGSYVGIGLSNPSAELEVSGNIKTKSIDILGGADVAEAFDISGELPKPGMVVVIDEKQPGYLKLSTEAYDKKVAGIVSGANNLKPGVILNNHTTKNQKKLPIALAGRVWVAVTEEGGKISPGDFLTTSSTPGKAMKVKENAKAAGAVIGKAMSENISGYTLVLINLN